MSKFQKLQEEDSNDYEMETHVVEIVTAPVAAATPKKVQGTTYEVLPSVDDYDAPPYELQQQQQQQQYDHDTQPPQYAPPDPVGGVEAIPIQEYTTQLQQIPMAVAVPSLQVKCVTITGQVLHVQLMEPDPSVLDVKLNLEQQKDFPVAFQKLVFGGREIKDSENLARLGFEDGYTIHLLLKKNDVVTPPGGQAPQQNADQGGEQDVAVDISVVEDHTRIHKLLNLSRAVKLVSIIDAMFLVLWSFSWWPFCTAVILAWCGYYGATLQKEIYSSVHAVRAWEYSSQTSVVGTVGIVLLHCDSWHWYMCRDVHFICCNYFF